MRTSENSVLTKFGLFHRPSSEGLSYEEPYYGRVLSVEVLRATDVGTLGKRLGSRFESPVHLLEPAHRVGIQASSQQADEHSLERFVLNEPNAVLFQRLDSKGVLPVEQTRNQQVADPPNQAVRLCA